MNQNTTKQIRTLDFWGPWEPEVSGHLLAFPCSFFTSIKLNPYRCTFYRWVMCFTWKTVICSVTNKQLFNRQHEVQ